MLNVAIIHEMCINLEMSYEKGLFPHYMASLDPSHQRPKITISSEVLKYSFLGFLGL